MVMTGVVVKAYGDYYSVQTNQKVILCTVKGRMKQERFTLVVGDQVDYKVTGEGKGIIEKIHPRTSLLKRPLVANISQVVVTFACCNPDYSLDLIDRFLVLVESSALQPILCFNKVDLADRDEMEAVAEIYRRIGYKVFFTDAKSEAGISELRALLDGEITVFSGPSGAGKSTLLNAIESGLLLKTGQVSDKIGRGRHTTRHAELLPLKSGGFVVDTPGFSFTEITLPEDTVKTCFPEFYELPQACKFSSCLHDKEPQCQVKEAVAQGRISSSRYENYVTILHEAQANKKGYGK
ncbi:MAG: ribosome small subunit-dependent GTPase A [Sporomusaceae bacterium]|nr:ribosome small subunit-dependent GTPase A [Sporomusaceae bacterium]